MFIDPKRLELDKEKIVYGGRRKRSRMPEDYSWEGHEIWFSEDYSFCCLKAKSLVLVQSDFMESIAQ